MALREFVLKKSNVQVVNFYKRVFETADVDSSILIFNNSNHVPTIKLSEAVEKDKIELIKELGSDFFLIKKEFIINIELLKNDTFIVLLDKIEENSLELNKLSDVKCGIKAYQVGKGKPIQTKHTKESRVFHSQFKKNDRSFKYIEGTDVNRYLMTWQKHEYICYGKHLAEPRTNWDLFSTPRILVRQIPSKPPYCINACFTDEILINDLNSMNIINIKCNPIYLLGVLNSRVISFWFIHKFGKMQRGLFPQFKINELAIFPIPDISDKQQQPIITLVNQILEAKQENSQTETSDLEHQIDIHVYKIYNLTYDEVKTIDPEVENKISREVYDADNGRI